jgi:hypothetical protein
MAVLDELLVSLGFEYDDAELEEFQRDLDKSIGLLKTIAKAAVAAAGALVTFTVASTRATDEQGKLADEIGVTISELDALQFAGSRAGASVDGVNSSLRGLLERAGEAARGVGAGVEIFGILGVEVQGANGQLKSATQLFTEVSGAISDLDRGSQIEMAKKLGLEGAIRLLQQGPGAIRELVGEANALGVATAEDARISADFQDSLTDLWAIVRQLGRTLSREVAPILTKIANTVSEWWKQNREVIEQNLPKWIDGLMRSLKILAVIIASVIAAKFLTFLATSISLTKTLTTTMLAFNAAALLIPILMGAAILLLIGLIEDAVVFFRGGESVFGDLIAKFPEFERELTTVAGIFNAMWETVKLIAEGWGLIFELIGKIKIPEFSGIGTAQQGEAAREARENFQFGDLLSIFSTRGFDLPPEFQTQSATNNAATNNIDKIEINVNGSGDPREIANETFKMFMQATQDLETPVDI